MKMTEKNSLLKKIVNCEHRTQIKNHTKKNHTERENLMSA